MTSTDYYNTSRNSGTFNDAFPHDRPGHDGGENFTVEIEVTRRDGYTGDGYGFAIDHYPHGKYGPDGSPNGDFQAMDFSLTADEARALRDMLNEVITD